jgi:hypothetical protein
MSTFAQDAIAPRKVGLPLLVGIAVLPIVFVWFLLRKGHGNIERLVGFSWLAFVCLMAALAHSPQSTEPPASTATTDDTATPGTSSPNIIANSDAPAWTYSENKDEMRGSTEKFAEIVSTNVLHFRFPYSGGSVGHVAIRKSPQFGIDVMLGITNGQFICSEYRADHVNIKFDDGPIKKYSCTTPSDGDPKTLFLRPTGALIKSFKNSRSAIIEAPFYQEGMQQLHFNTRGLRWP